MSQPLARPVNPPPKQRHLYAVKIVQTAEVLVCAEDEETAHAIVAESDMSHEFPTDSPPSVVSMREVRRGDEPPKFVRADYLPYHGENCCWSCETETPFSEWFEENEWNAFTESLPQPLDEVITEVCLALEFENDREMLKATNRENVLGAIVDFIEFDPNIKPIRARRKAERYLAIIMDRAAKAGYGIS